MSGVGGFGTQFKSAEGIRSVLVDMGSVLVERHGVEFIIGESDKGRWAAWPMPADETTPAAHTFDARSEDDEDDYGALAEEIADWVREPKR